MDATGDWRAFALAFLELIWGRRGNSKLETNCKNSAMFVELKAVILSHLHLHRCSCSQQRQSVTYISIKNGFKRTQNIWKDDSYSNHTLFNRNWTCQPVDPQATRHVAISWHAVALENRLQCCWADFEHQELQCWVQMVLAQGGGETLLSLWNGCSCFFFKIKWDQTSTS